ncbi:hypothetical protein HDU76_009317, partial [Blyttiomyces sp. JEL0837]
STSTNTSPNPTTMDLQFLLPTIPTSTNPIHSSTSPTTYLSTLTLSSTKPRRPIPHFPNELLLLIFSYLPTSTLLLLRLTTHKLKNLTEVTLEQRLTTQIESLEQTYEKNDEVYRALEKEKRPHLRHYRGFLRNVSINDVTEATWYASPPEELKTVCECLCILRGGANFGGMASTPTSRKNSITSVNSISNGLNNVTISHDPESPRSSTTTPAPSSAATSAGNSPTTSTAASTGSNTTITPVDNASLPPFEPNSWSTIKKTMTRYDFKTWLTNLRVGVDYIPFANVKRVEKIIMMDPDITYERLREVSTAGYKLLILVAACLQYCSIAEDLKGRRRDVVLVEKRCSKLKYFLEVGVRGVGKVESGNGSKGLEALMGSGKEWAVRK